MRRTSFSSRRTFGGRKPGGARRSASGRRGPATTTRRARSRNRGETIDPGQFVRTVTSVKTEGVFVPKHTFNDFALSGRLRQNVAERGYTTPTPVQDESIIPIFEGRDLIGLANTGTGKTAAFLLPIMEKLQASKAQLAVLIVVPTRELAIQIAEEFRAFASGLGITASVCVGGVPIGRQIEGLRRKPNVIIGTPGRLKDLANQHKLHLDKVSTLVLDEADHMMDMGFLPDVRFIINLLPKKRQSLCFSATLPPEIDKLIRDLLIDPVTVSVRTGVTCDNVDQNVLRADTARQKIEILIDLFKQKEFSKILIFGRTKHGVQRLANDLSKSGLEADAIHGNKSQNQRQKALQGFKSDKTRILVATDVAARGLDIPNVSHVINFDQPSTYVDYIHRIGRTGRAGKTGKALTFVPTHARV